jgi:hypothetical protein
MSTLTNEEIKNTYPGLIKTVDNLPLDATQRVLTDGIGNTLPMSASTVGINYNGVIDFSAATVTGLPTPDNAGLVTGDIVGNSMKSNNELSTNPSYASRPGSIALGSDARSQAYYSIAIGNSARTTDSGSAGQSGVAIGNGANGRGEKSVAIGYQTYASAGGISSVSIGESAYSSQHRSVSIGRQCRSQSQNTISIGNYADINGTAPGSIFMATSMTGPGGVKSAGVLMITPGSYGGKTVVGSDRVIGLGVCSAGNETKCTGSDSIAIGTDAIATVTGAVALGKEVVASIVDTTTVNELEIQKIGGGIIMHSPDGTAYKLTVSNAGLLIVAAV